MSWASFAIGSLILVVVSRRSLLIPGSHGFYRFFAWEAILALFVVNVSEWFVDPFAWHQLVSWTVLTASLVPLVFGVDGLRSLGRPDEARTTDPALLAFERTTALVTTGVYRFIRHPLYCSLLLLAWGIFFKSPSAGDGLLATAATVALVLTARADEAECVAYFGGGYAEYMQHTKRFVPFVW